MGTCSTHTWLPLQSNVFDEYRIEGKDDRNEIYLELNIEQLARALKSALTAQVLKIKLTKKQGPCLTLEIALVSSQEVTLQLSWSAILFLVDNTETA